MPTKTPYKVYVIQGRGQRDYTDCQAALAHVPAHVETLPFIGDVAEVIERTRDANTRPLHVVNPDVYATGHHRRSP